ncbi:MAG TPA: hypothetical protein VLC95_11510 [Anaerolineae bacterium]|nr:hypothetical protein [Anaerolineae bacterium]
MSLITRDDLTKVSVQRDGWHVSLYMPTHRLGAEAQQDPIRLKNLLDRAEEEIMERGARRPTAEAILAPARTLLDDAGFWRYQSDGLAILAAEGVFRVFRLPLNFEEQVAVGRRFYVKPLLPMLSREGHFYILALSQNDVRLLQGTRYAVGEVDLDDVPTSLAEALRFDDPEAELQFHTATASPHARGEQPAVFHGTGAGSDDKDDQLLRYFQKVSAGIDDLLGEEQAPLVLAGVEYLLPIYREASSYSYLLDEQVTGNPDEMSAAELHSQAWEVVEPVFAKEQHRAADLYPQLEAAGKASNDLERVVAAAHYGRVDTLFVSLGQEQWGTFDPDSRRMEAHEERQAEDEDLLDLAALQTLLNGGMVFAVPSEQVPGGGALAALFRY